MVIRIKLDDLLTKHNMIHFGTKFEEIIFQNILQLKLLRASSSFAGSFPRVFFSFEVSTRSGVYCNVFGIDQCPGVQNVVACCVFSFHKVLEDLRFVKICKVLCNFLSGLIQILSTWCHAINVCEEHLPSHPTSWNSPSRERWKQSLQFG